MRINIIDPAKLTDQHLIAEYHELLMVTKSLERNLHTNSAIPEKFCLGRGHVNFFKNKIGYLKKRHKELIGEMHQRGFNTNHKIHTENFPKQYDNDWSPVLSDYKVIQARIIERILQKPEWYRYYGKHLTKESLIELTVS